MLTLLAFIFGILIGCLILIIGGALWFTIPAIVAVILLNLIVRRMKKGNG